MALKLRRERWVRGLVERTTDYGTTRQRVVWLPIAVRVRPQGVNEAGRVAWILWTFSFEPSEVPSPLQHVEFFVAVGANIADEDLAGPWVLFHLPRIAKTERIDRPVDTAEFVKERIVTRNRAVGVEADDRTCEVCTVLAVAAEEVISNRDVEPSIWTVFDGATVVEVDIGVGEILKEHDLIRRSVAVYRETRETSPANTIVGAVRIEHVHDVDEAVLREVVVERNVEQAAITKVINATSEVEQGCSQQSVILYDVRQPRVGHHEEATVGGELHADWREDFVRNPNIGKIRRRVRRLSRIGVQRQRREHHDEADNDGQTAQRRLTQTRKPTTEHLHTNPFTTALVTERSALRTNV